jgi:hypothetical protein
MKLVYLLALTIVLIACQSGVTIYFVSNDPSAVVRPVYSSLRGGKLVYIKAMGHDPNPNNLKIFVGPYPCIIPADGVTDTFITCETTDTGSLVDIYSQTIALYQNGVLMTTTSSPNHVHFRTY